MDMGCDLPDWTTMDEPACLLYEAGSEPEYVAIPCIRRGEDEGPMYTPEEEERLMTKQVEESQGFDMNFKEFRCIFNYQPLDFDDNEFAREPETTRELMDRLSQGALQEYNVDKDPKYEFVKVIKANYHMNTAAAAMFFITFEGKDLSNDQPKHFQARVCNFFYNSQPKYISCDLKPEKKVPSIETGEKIDGISCRLNPEKKEKEGVKKPRLTELSNV